MNHSFASLLPIGLHKVCMEFVRLVSGFSFLLVVVAKLMGNRM